MSTHPNAILLLVLTPDGLSRKTHRAILEEMGDPGDENFKIEGEMYHCIVMEDDYDETYQIMAKEGDICVFDLITYGYGERIDWDKLVGQHAILKNWAEDVCKRHNCTAKYYVTANYW